MEWWAAHRARFRACISNEVVAELSAPAFAGATAALRMLQGLDNLELSPESRQLAQVLVDEKVMPGPAVSGDAMHVAVATVYQMDYLLSWNVRHLANINKRMHLINICTRLGSTPPQIITPDLLWEAPDE